MINKTLVKNALANKPLERKPNECELKAIKAGLPALGRGLQWRVYKSGSIGIQISFTYKGVSCREIIDGLKNKKKDIEYAVARQGEIVGAMARNTFKYADFFPNSKKLEVFGEAKSNATLGFYIDQYITTCVKKNLKPDTIEKKRQNKGRLVSINQTPIKEINRRLLKDYFSNVTVSLRSAKMQLELIRNALSEAIIDEVIEFNPCHDFKIANYVDAKQKVYNTQDEADPFDLIEVSAILAEAYKKNETAGNAIQLWLNTGLRTGEIFGLTWECIDLKNRKLYIKQTVVKSDVRDSGKNKHAIREVPLNDAAIEALERQKPLSYFQQSFLFSNIKNKTYQNSICFRENVWKGVLQRAGVRYRRPYNCRHTFATMHISSCNNVNMWKLSQWMGHTSPSMIEKHYGKFKELYENIDSMVGLSLSNIANTQVQIECKL